MPSYHNIVQPVLFPTCCRIRSDGSCGESRSNWIPMSSISFANLLFGWNGAQGWWIRNVTKWHLPGTKREKKTTINWQLLKLPRWKYRWNPLWWLNLFYIEMNTSTNQYLPATKKINTYQLPNHATANCVPYENRKHKSIKMNLNYEPYQLRGEKSKPKKTYSQCRWEPILRTMLLLTLCSKNEKKCSTHNQENHHSVSS